MTFTVVTYGGGELLEVLFNAMAVLINGQSGVLFQPLVRLGLMVGLGMATLSAVGGQHLHLITRWMIPFYIMLTFFLAPTCTVNICDPTLRQPPFRVDHVPWGLGAVAGTLSKLGDGLTQKLESILALPDDLSYHKTGAMLASQLIAHSHQFHVTNVDLAETLRSFVNQCVVYDALLGQKYTLQDLKQSDDLWGLVSQHPSPARSFLFKHPGKGGKSELCTCKEGVQKLKPYLEQDVQTAFQVFGNQWFGGREGRGSTGGSLLNPSQQLKQYLPLAFGYMAKMSKSAAELMKQQMMIYAVVDATQHQSEALGNAPNVAIRRAYLQQRAQEETMAGVAGQKLLAVKNVLEALIYASFMFLSPMVLVPAGWRYFLRWCGLVAWIQLWAPLYAVLNFVMNVTAKSKGMGLVGLDPGTGLTIANSVGFSNLHADMASHAGMLSWAVGGLAYGLVRGGAAGIQALSHHLQGSVSAASSRASEEMLSGNYSFGNVSEGTVQAYNTTLGQQMLSPSYGSGAFSQQDGMVSRVTSSQGQHLVSVASSGLRSTINWSESLSNAYTSQASLATQAASNQLLAAAESEGDALKHFCELNQHHATQIGHQKSNVQGLSAQVSESVTTLKNKVATFALGEGV